MSAELGVNKLGVSGNVIVDLASAAAVPHNSGYKLFFDNYFTSVPLMDELTKRGICASGTCRENRTGKCPLISLKKAARGTTDFRSSSNVAIIEWKDNKEVILASNYESFAMTTTQRWDKVQKKYISVPQPESIRNYNKYMGYIDQLDQNISTYRIRMWQNKWWWPIFSYMLSVAVNNACLLMSKTGKNITLYQFIEHVSLSLSKTHRTPKAQMFQKVPCSVNLNIYEGCMYVYPLLTSRNIRYYSYYNSYKQ